MKRANLFPMISVSKRYRRLIETKQNHGPLVQTSSSFVSARARLAVVASKAPIEQLADALADNAMSSFALYVAELLEQVAVPDQETKEEVVRCLEVICEDFDLTSAALSVLADPEAAEDSLRQLLRRGPCEYQPGESASSFAERSLRVQLAAGEHMVLQAAHGLVDRLALCMYAGDEAKRATVAAYFIGNSNRRAEMAAGQ